MSKINKEAAEEQFVSICEELFIDPASFETEDDDKDSKKKIIAAIMFGYLSYENEVFTLGLKKPITVGKDGDQKTYDSIQIFEPSASDLREMDKVKGKNADIGKTIAVLGAISKMGVAKMNKMRSRDMMTAAAVMSLFL